MVTSYIRPCVSGTLSKVTFPVYACTVAYRHFLQGNRKKRPCLYGHVVINSQERTHDIIPLSPRHAFDPPAPPFTQKGQFLKNCAQLFKSLGQQMG